MEQLVLYINNQQRFLLCERNTTIICQYLTIYPCIVHTVDNTYQQSKTKKELVFALRLNVCRKASKQDIWPSSIRELCWAIVWGWINDTVLIIQFVQHFSSFIWYSVSVFYFHFRMKMCSSNSTSISSYTKEEFVFAICSNCVDIALVAILLKFFYS